MTHCDYCRQEIESETMGQIGTINTGGLHKVKPTPIALPFMCRRCGGKYCPTHRLPENHNCNVLENLGDWGKFKPPGKYQTSSFPSPKTASYSKSNKIIRHISWKYPFKKIYYFVLSFLGQSR